MSLRGGPRGPPPQERAPRPYKVLCVSSLHPKASDDVVRDTLYREYKKFGDISVRIVLEPDERVAYVYFRNFEDARDARHSKSRIILFDKPAIVEPVYESRSESASYSRPRQRSVTPPPPYYPRYRSRSPSERYREPSYRDDGYHNQDHYREYQPRPYRGRGGYMGGRGGYYPSRGGYDGGGYVEGPKRDKFPNYLTHIPPEDDPLATRTLFAGNLEVNITEEEMRKIFGRYGHLMDVDIKRPPPGTGNAYAFVRYENLDMAHRAKLELSGQYIGKFQCKVGYGKINSTSKVWVGGLGSWCSESLLWKEFDRFGAIKKIDYHKGEPWAHIYYEMLDSAQAAVQEMRGFPLGGPDKRLRIDFSDLEVNLDEPGDDYDGRRSSSLGKYPAKGRYTYADDWQGGSRRVEEPLDRWRHRSRGSSYSPPPSHRSELVTAQTIGDICRKTPKVWDGGLILKNSLFPTKLHLIEGDRHIADDLTGDEVDGSKSQLKITQRLRLDQSKLDDVTKRMSSAASHAIFLGLTTSTPVEHGNPEVQSRPLWNLISYLKQKEAAGVISLNEVHQGVLYCFPPCSYSMELLRREAPSLLEEGKDDYLVVVVVCGNHS